MENLGEKAFLATLLPKLGTATTFVNGFGHDASVVDLGFDSENIVMKIDRAAKPIAALNGWTSFELWGRLAVTANCSDILAVGGEPRAFMLAISAPPETPAKVIEEITLGAASECSKNSVAFLGGDTKEASEMSVVGSAIGKIPKERHFSRKLGLPGHLIILAGELGGYVGAYWARTNLLNADLTAADDFLANPKARWKEASAIANSLQIISASDLSDGLVDAIHNVVADGAGAIIYEDELPFHALARVAASSSGISLRNFAFGVGDWGIIYTAPESDYAAIRELQNRGLRIKVIGKVQDRKRLTLVSKTSSFAVSESASNEHFRSRMEDQGDWFQSLLSGEYLEEL